MKCQRCGDEAVVAEGHELRKASGPDATTALMLKGRFGTVAAKVCDSCATMLRLRKLGWR